MMAQKDKPGGAVGALVDNAEAGRRRQFLARRDLDNRERIRGQPAGHGQPRQGRRGNAAVIGRIEKRQRAGESGTRRPGRVAADDVRAVFLPKRGDVAAQGAKRLAPVLDEGGGAGAARQRFKAKGAGACESIEHGAVGKGQPGGGEIAVRQDVEQRLSGAVTGRTHRVAGRRGEPPAAMATADDAHAPRRRDSCRRAVRPAPFPPLPRLRRAPDDRVGRARRQGG